MASRDDLLAEILAECQEQKDRGEIVDYEAILAEHADLAEELRHYLSLSNRMDGVHDDPPARIGDYEIRREIGRGGMGIVYEALQLSIDRPVALKLLHTAFLRSSDAIARFRREARAAGQLRHANIVPIRETGRERGIWYIAMELVDGEPLNRLIDGLGGRTESVMPLPEGEEYYRFVAERFAGVADALEEAHAAGVIHRDIKPGNLILARTGLLMIVDFGLARLTSAGSMTATGSMLGTPEYMSPEQALVTGTKIDHRTDIYSLSATLYELLTPRPAFSGTSVGQICAAIAANAPTPPRKIDPRIPLPLENIVLRGMAKDPAQRYQTAAELSADLRRFAMGEPTIAKRARPGWLVPGLVAVALVLLAAFLFRPDGDDAPVPGIAAKGKTGEADHEAALRLERTGSRRKALALEKAGRLEEALAEMNGACSSQNLPPHSARLRILMELGRYDEMLQRCRESQKQVGSTPGLMRNELVALRALGRHAEARKLATKLIAGGRGMPVARAYAFAVLGREDDSRTALESANKQPYENAWIYSILKDRAGTLRSLTEAKARGEVFPPNARYAPDLAVWNDDDDIQALLRSMRRRAR